MCQRQSGLKQSSPARAGSLEYQVQRCPIDPATMRGKVRHHPSRHRQLSAQPPHKLTAALTTAAGTRTPELRVWPHGEARYAAGPASRPTEPPTRYRSLRVSGLGILARLRVRACIAGPDPTPPTATCDARPLHCCGSFSNPRCDHLVRNPRPCPFPILVHTPVIR